MGVVRLDTPNPEFVVAARAKDDKSVYLVMECCDGPGPIFPINLQCVCIYIYIYIYIYMYICTKNRGHCLHRVSFFVTRTVLEFVSRLVYVV